MEGTSNPRTTSIITYIGIVGVLIAISINAEEKHKLASFHIRQGLGLSLICIILMLSLKDLGIPYFFWLYLVFMISIKAYGIMSVIHQNEKPFPIVGQLFQKWFKFL